MKRIILLIAFCLSLSAIYAQTIDVIHLKNGFDARGTITNRTESQIILQSENGRILTIDMSEIESMEQEQTAFDPRVLIGRWACYKASGERDDRFDIEISENEGFYIISYKDYLDYFSNDKSILCYAMHSNPTHISQRTQDIDIDDDSFNYRYFREEHSWVFANSRKEYEYLLIKLNCNISLKYHDGKLKGNIDCVNYFHAYGCERYRFVMEALDGCGTIAKNGPGGKWNVYFVKY